MEGTNNVEQINQMVPEGKYVCELKRFFKRESKSGNPQVAWVFEIQDPDFKGMLLWKNSMLNSERGTTYFLEHEMPALGMFPTSVEDAIECGAKLLNKRILIEVRQQKGKTFQDLIIIGGIKRVGEKNLLLQIICSEIPT